MKRGYIGGDLKYYADRWAGRNNNGEFTVEGTFFNTE
jgi:hypothetical protein